MTSRTKVEIVRPITATETEFCACCGLRIKAGETVSLIRRAINERGRYAHESCCVRHNRAVDAQIVKDAREADMIPVCRAEDLLVIAVTLAAEKQARS
jgi:hypothetical protein